ncbi:hypothetical protein H9P43_006355 [Blastocladiella emersonii ATCC 22665]|nr:hypothetical protein H9P43_006355 [Blastocladiella emersonii ATCC 22665]
MAATTTTPTSIPILRFEATEACPAPPVPDPRAGLSANQIAALAQAELSISQDPQLTPEQREWADTPCLLRYLRATAPTKDTYDAQAALTKLRGTLAWRAAEKPHELTADAAMREQGALGKQVAHGFSRAGHPVLYMLPRNENSADEDAQFAFVLFNLELAIRRMPPGVEKVVLVIDFNGMTLAKRMSPAMQRRFVDTLSAHYPERLHCACMVNAPWFFWAAWKVIAPFIDPVTRAKVSFVTLDPPGAGKSRSSSMSSLSPSGSASDVSAAAAAAAASPPEPVPQKKPSRFSLGGLFSRSASTPTASAAADEGAPAEPVADGKLMYTQLVTDHLWADYGGDCAFQWDAAAYFAAVDAFLADAEAQRVARVAALVESMRLEAEMPVEDDE